MTLSIQERVDRLEAKVFAFAIREESAPVQEYNTHNARARAIGMIERSLGIHVGWHVAALTAELGDRRAALEWMTGFVYGYEWCRGDGIMGVQASAQRLGARMRTFLSRHEPRLSA